MFNREREQASRMSVVKFRQLPDGRFSPDLLQDRNCLKLHGVEFKPTRDWDDVLRQLSKSPLWARHPTMVEFDRVATK